MNYLPIFLGWLIAVFVCIIFIILSPIFLIGALFGNQWKDGLPDLARYLFETEEQHNQRKIDECPLKDKHN